MTDVMANMVVDVHSADAKQTLFRDSNCFLIESTVNGYSLWQMWLKVVVYSSGRSLCDDLYDRHHSRFNIGFHGI